MSDWPQLEQRLLESARRSATRRKRLRPRRLVPLMAALATAAVLLAVIDYAPAGPPISADEHSVTATPTADSEHLGSPLQRFYGVFRQPASRDDVLPGGVKLRRQWARGCDRSEGVPMCLRADTARLVGRDGNQRFYLLQGRDPDDLCIVGYVDSDSVGGMACTIADAERLAKPMGSYGPPRDRRPAGGYTVFPDGVKRVAYTFADGATAVRDVKRNFAYVTGEHAITSLAWIVGGRRYVQTVADVDPNDRAAGSSCPALEPLPPSVGPAATRAATRAAATLAGVSESDVTVTRIRPATATDLDDLRRRACGDVPAERSLVVELTATGQPDSQLLIGFRGGAAIVWSQLR